MQPEKLQIEAVQKILAKTIATSPAGVNLLLIGGFRYRLLDRSQRFSVDIDYHWSDDLESKQQELIALCKRSLLGQIKRQFGYDGSVFPASGPDSESPNVRLLELRFWKGAAAFEIPIEITRICCLDPPTIKTAEGVVHATVSDADLIESKLLAVVNRLYLQHRDLVDVFLFQDRLREDYPARVHEKQKRLQLSAEAIAKRIQDLRDNPKYHAAAIDKVLREQVEVPTTRQIEAGGGGHTVLQSGLSVLERIWPS